MFLSDGIRENECEANGRHGCVIDVITISGSNLIRTTGTRKTPQYLV
jgi:hypothetical protein